MTDWSGMVRRISRQMPILLSAISFNLLRLTWPLALWSMIVVMLQFSAAVISVAFWRCAWWHALCQRVVGNIVLFGEVSLILSLTFPAILQFVFPMWNGFHCSLQGSGCSGCQIGGFGCFLNDRLAVPSGCIVAAQFSCT